MFDESSFLPFDHTSYVHRQKKHNKVTTIQHWQLRDLIHATSSTDIYYVNKKTINKYTTTENKHMKELELRFEPSCMTVGHGLVVAGGQSGQITMKLLAVDRTWKLETLEGKINNSATIAKVNGNTHILITNNDKTIKIFTTSSTGIEQMSEIRTPVAMNYASVSPDGNFMVSTGDSREVLLHSVKNNIYERIQTFIEAKDSGMCCAWNNSSTHFAVASQDGLVCVWDIRSRKPISKLHSEGTNIACRNVKYSPNSWVDLLVFSEHTSLIHIVDSRTYSNEQIIRTTPESEDQHISGISFSPDCNRIFVGMEGYIMEYDIDTLSRRQFQTFSLL